MSTADKWRGLERVAESIAGDELGEDEAAVIEAVRQHLAREFGPLLDAAETLLLHPKAAPFRECTELDNQLEKFR